MDLSERHATVARTEERLADIKAGFARANALWPPFRLVEGAADA